MPFSICGTNFGMTHNENLVAFSLFKISKMGKGLSPFSFPPIPRDVATSEAGSCAFVIDLN